MKPLFVYRGEQSPIDAGPKAKLVIGGSILGGIAITMYSLYHLILSFSLLSFITLCTGLLLSLGYGWLWNKTKTQVVFPTFMEVNPTYFYLKKYNELSELYQEWVLPIKQIQVIIERRLETYRGTVYLVPAIHLLDLTKEDSFELFFDGDESINLYLKAIIEAGGMIRFLPYCLDYCSKAERLQAFREETIEIVFSGNVSDYVSRNQEAYFYSEQLEYKQVLQERKRRRSNH